jgi:hypothetical protein
MPKPLPRWMLPRKFLLTSTICASMTASALATGKPIPVPPPTPPRPAVVASAETPYTHLTLSEALSVAHEKQPWLTAGRASMNAAMLKNRGLEDARKSGAALLMRDLDVRKQQVDIGIKAAIAEYEQTQHEVSYAVIRCYYTVVYARTQVKVAKDLVDQLEVYLEQVHKIVTSKGGGVRGITKDTEDKLIDIVARAKAKQIEAESGVDRARAAFREALGLGAESKVDVADTVLPNIKASIDKETVLAHAITRRGEAQLAQFGADASRLEIVAQWARRFTVQVPTFANGNDIHARHVPPPHREPDYKPGAIPPDMPDRFVGKRDTRTMIAGQHAEKAQAAAEQAKNMLALEAEIAYSKWNEASRKVDEAYTKAVKASKELIERQREATGGNLTKEDILANEVAAAMTYASLNEAIWDQIVALSNLERVTAGGVRVNFPGR